MINCKRDLNSTLALNSFLGRFPRLLNSGILQSPSSLMRKEGPRGIIGYVINNSSHVIIHTFPDLKQVTIYIYSYYDFNENEIKSQIIDFLQVTPLDLRISRNSQTVEEFIECEVSSCKSKAKKVWGGLNVCRDHYEQFKEDQLNKLNEMNEY